MYEFLLDFCKRPEPFARCTVKDLWTAPHLSQQMLTYHLSQDTVLASRTFGEIDCTVAWVDAQVDLRGKRLCDLGCGPGLYAQRFQARGAEVTGVDFSSRSIAYARDHSNSTVRYLVADYLQDELPQGFDVVTLIYTDFCVLSPQQRISLLERVRCMLKPGGRFILDVATLGEFLLREETTVMEERLMGGFWAPGEYVGLQKTFLYEDTSLALDRYLIVEPDRCWEIFNWFQYYSIGSISRELESAGFEVAVADAGFSGGDPSDESLPLGVVAVRS